MTGRNDVELSPQPQPAHVINAFSVKLCENHIAADIQPKMSDNFNH